MISRKCGTSSELCTVAVVTTVKAGWGAIDAFIEHHLGLGVKRIFLFVDDANAAICSQVRAKYSREVTVFECNDEYWLKEHSVVRPAAVETRQKLNAGRALQLARQAGLTWLAHVDVDEYIFCFGRKLDAVLSEISSECNVVRMKVLESIRCGVDETHDGVNQYFRSLPLPIPIRDGRYGLGLRLRAFIMEGFYRSLFFVAGRVLRHGAFSDGYYDFFRAHYIGKSIFRVSGEVISVGLHHPNLSPSHQAKIVCPPDCAVLHFESLSFEEWVGKWRRRMSAEGRAEGLDRRQRGIFLAFRSRAADVSGLKELYKHLYVMSVSDRRQLARFGLVKAVKLEDMQ